MRFILLASMEVIFCSYLILFGKSQSATFLDFIDRFGPAAVISGNTTASKLAACLLLLLYSKLGLIFLGFGLL